MTASPMATGAAPRDTKETWKGFDSQGRMSPHSPTWPTWPGRRRSAQPPSTAMPSCTGRRHAARCSPLKTCSQPTAVRSLPWPKRSSRRCLPSTAAAWASSQQESRRSTCRQGTCDSPWLRTCTTVIKGHGGRERLWQHGHRQAGPASPAASSHKFRMPVADMCAASLCNRLRQAWPSTRIQHAAHGMPSVVRRLPALLLRNCCA